MASLPSDEVRGRMQSSSSQGISPQPARPEASSTSSNPNPSPYPLPPGTVPATASSSQPPIPISNPSSSSSAPPTVSSVSQNPQSDATQFSNPSTGIERDVGQQGDSSGVNERSSQFSIQKFWKEQNEEIEKSNDFKSHGLPLQRIKRIMKSDDDIKMVSAETPALFAKACELFILELTLRSWEHTEESKRKTLQRSDISAAISRTDTYDFLIDIVPREDMKSPSKKIDESVRSPSQSISHQPPEFHQFFFQPPIMNTNQQPQPYPPVPMQNEVSQFWVQQSQQRFQSFQEPYFHRSLHQPPFVQQPHQNYSPNDEEERNY